MDEHPGCRAALGMRSAEAAEAASVIALGHAAQRTHVAVWGALAVLLREVAADQDDLAPEHRFHRSGALIEATQDVHQPVGRDRLERCGRREQYRVGHFRRLGAGEQCRRKGREPLAVRRRQIGGDAALHAVAVGDQFGEGDRRRLVPAGILVEVIHCSLDRCGNRQAGRPRQHEPFVVPGERIVEAAIVMGAESRKAVRRVAEDDVEPDRLYAGFGQPVDQLGPDRPE